MNTSAIKTTASKTKEIWVNKQDYRETKSLEQVQSELSDGEVRVAIDKFALTSNNIGYAVSGESIGYWRYFPTNDENWGKVTVWGMADVVESKHPEVSIGERLYGFFPMASHLVVKPDNVKKHQFIDGSEHRQALPVFYNQYQRCQAEPEMLKAFEDERCVLFPLYMTGFIIADYLLDNSYFNAEQIIIGSVSSKTGYSLASFLRSNGYQGKIVGLTSNGNIEFVKSLGFCDQVTAYDAVETLDTVSSVYIDMAGNSQVLANLHHHLQDNMKSSQIVGATHWESFTGTQKLPGCKPQFFFTPAHIKKRSEEWGPVVLMEKAMTAAATLAHKLSDLIVMEHHQGADDTQQLWRDLLDNKVSGQRGLMLSLLDE